MSDPFDVQCPVCEAQIGDPCDPPGSEPHFRRRKKAEQIDRAAADNREAAFRELIRTAEVAKLFLTPGLTPRKELETAIAAARAVVGEG